MFRFKKAYLNDTLLLALKLELWAYRVREEIKIKKTSWDTLATRCNLRHRQLEDMATLNVLRKTKYKFQKIPAEREFRIVNKLRLLLDDSGSLWTPNTGQRMCMTIHLQCWKYSQGREYGKEGVGYELNGQPYVEYLFPIKNLKQEFISMGWLETEKKEGQIGFKFILSHEGHKLSKVKSAKQIVDERENASYSKGRGWAQLRR